MLLLLLLLPYKNSKSQYEQSLVIYTVPLPLPSPPQKGEIGRAAGGGGGVGGGGGGTGGGGDCRHGGVGRKTNDTPLNTHGLRPSNRFNDNKWAAVIFPEGTRSRDGNPKSFKTKGLLSMFNYMPDALVVPITINNSWKTLRYGKFPMGLGANISFKVHQPIPLNTIEDKLDLIQQIETQIKNDILR